MRKLFLLTLLLLTTTLLSAQTVADYIREAKALIAKLDETGAYPLLLKAIKADNKNVEALTLAALYASREGNRQQNKGLRNGYFNQGKVFIDAAMRLSPDDAEVNYVMAVVLGRIALVSSSKEKVAVSRQIKEVIDKAIKINPNHAGAWHALGKWNYEVSQLSFIEKGAVNMLFGGLPTGDLKTALSAYAKCLQLRQDYLLYYLDYAKALAKNDQKDLAIAQLRKLISLPNGTQDDAAIKTEAASLIAEWK